jgi:hypothetical protein
MSEEQKEAQETAREKAIKAAAATNATRTGIGPRLKVGATRGKNPTVITFENFDTSQPESLPKSVAEFMENVTQDQPTLLDYLIRGYNDAMNEAASDPLAEYVSDVWSPEVQLTFRTAVRNYAKGLGLELEQAVNIIRPGFASKFGN